MNTSNNVTETEATKEINLRLQELDEARRWMNTTLDLLEGFGNRHDEHGTENIPRAREKLNQAIGNTEDAIAELFLQREIETQ